MVRLEKMSARPMTDRTIRPLTSSDLPEALALQAQGYPVALQDGPAAFASRIAVAPGWCWAAVAGGRLDGYLLSHPWTSLAPPSPDTMLTRAEGDVWYIHDLSTAAHARGQGVARALLAACEAAKPALPRSELVAIEGAAPFWSRLGWRVAEPEPEGLRAKLAAYGPAAVYMTRSRD